MFEWKTIKKKIFTLKRSLTILIGPHRNRVKKPGD